MAFPDPFLDPEQTLPFAREPMAFAPQASLGAALRAARVANQLSVSDLSKRTRIGQKFLIAIEEERFELFAGRIYATGFVTTYAREVGVSTKWALEALADAIDRTSPKWRRQDRPG